MGARKLKYLIPDFVLEKFLDRLEVIVRNAPNNIVIFVIDLFCGAGGTSEGFEQALFNDSKIATIIAGINHDLKAIYSQYVNHPDAYYSTEDIRFANLDMVKRIVAICRERWPQCPIFIWASLECTNHSNAKGGMSRDADSRTLAWHLDRYIKALDPDGMWIENVKEFSEWGPLMEKVILEKRVLNKKRKFVRKKITINEIIDPMKEQEFYAKAIKDGWKAYSPLIKIKEGRKVIGVTKTQIPIKSLKGTLYKPWKENMDKIGGFYNEQRYINCAEFGCPTNRKRLFIAFVREGWPITWPMPTHAKDVKKFPNLSPLVPVKTCLDFSVQGESIFTPGKISSPKTYRRILAGLIKYVAGGKEAYEFIVQRNGGNSRVISIDQPARTVTTTGGNMELVRAYFLTKYMGNNQETGINAGKSIEDPAPTITTQGRLGLVEVEHFLGKGYSACNNTDVNKGASIHDPAPTVTTVPNLSLVSTHFIAQHNTEKGDKPNSGTSIEDPAPTLTTIPTLRLVEADFLFKYYGTMQKPIGMNDPCDTLTTKDRMAYVNSRFLVNNQGKSNAASIDEPAPTILTREKLGLIDVTKARYFIYRQFSDGRLQDIDSPAGALPTVPKMNLVEIDKSWLMNTSFDNVGQSVNGVSDAILASRKHHYLMNPQWADGQGCAIDDPCFTIIARMDKAPPYLISTEGGHIIIPIFETDCPEVIQIKEFMALYGIVDIKMRMLLIMELLQIQSFPKNYFLAGSQTDKKKYIGNAVPPKMARALAEGMYMGLIEFILEKQLVP